MIKTYDQAVEYLKSFIPFTLYQTDAFQKKELKDPLDRMRYLLNLLDNPERKFKSVLVGGTSGKGSTSYLISHILTIAGYKTGLTLSPHLVRINERIQINNEEISDAIFVEMVNQVIPAIEQMRKSTYDVPSYFEITIAMAFLYFAKEEIDIAIVEVGMGGEYDATNTLEPLVAVLTNVSLDHTQFLGETVEEIAETKGGIIKNYELGITNYERPIVVTGVSQPSVIKIIENRCEKVGAKLYRLGKDFFVTDEQIGLEGEYQKENASLAIETIKQLHHFDFFVSESIIRKSLKTATFPGRFEEIKWKMENGKWKIILDGAHNPAKMHAFVTSLQKIYPQQKKVFIIAFKKDKNIEDMLKEIIPVAESIVATEFAIGTDTMISNASYKVDDLTSLILHLKSDTNIFIEKDSVKAVEKAISLACHSEQSEESYDPIIAITGSLYLIGELKQRSTVLA
ncbi:MAG: bifunctional folylpolyglutamate synthase/dihydrofolate synthase [Candidatus Levybacteria bacterium]|nr:bifunctional folylpolyglutamate synthase/dihydrofolate synthase [Candidatus Levybacteria bacterium]